MMEWCMQENSVCYQECKQHCVYAIEVHLAAQLVKVVYTKLGVGYLEKWTKVTALPASAFYKNAIQLVAHVIMH